MTTRAAPIRGLAGRRFSIAVQLLIGVAAAAASVPAAAQEAPLANPPELTVLRGPAVPAPMTTMAHEAAPVERVGNEARLELDVTYGYYRIWNASTKRYDVVRLRSYNGTVLAKPADASGWKDAPDPVGPTIRLKPGETVRATLSNQLPTEPCVSPEGTPNIPNCFNTTNLHSHGLHVTPTGNGDNVMLEVRPGETFQYEYNLPFDHPAGTFWYHAHRHGSTALQVSSGMAGALIIEGDRLPAKQGEAWLPGDIDTILRAGDKPFPERILLFEQPQYACRDPSGQIKVIKNRDGQVQAWKCDPDDVGGVEGYDQFGPGTWTQSGRYTILNGRLQPALAAAKVGQIERWRLIHAGVRDTIKLALYKASAPSSQLANLNAEERDKWTADNCKGPVIATQWEIAADGLTRPQIAAKGTIERGGKTVSVPNTLQPGYRSDVLVSFPEPGDYCVIDEQAPANETVNLQPKNRRLLATVHADGAKPVPDDKAFITQALVAAAEAVVPPMPPEAKARVVADLKSDLKLDLFVPHRTVADSEVEGHQDLVFSIDTGSPSPAAPDLRFGVNHLAYSMNRIDRVLKLGSVDEWVLTSTLANHPFHIHVNPFEVVKILDPSGKDVSGGDPNGDPDYWGLKGVWKDTLFVRAGYRVYIRTRYERYIGDFVLHCHILDHEDQGMMENVRISLSGDGERHGNH